MAPFLFCIETCVINAASFMKDVRFKDLLADRGYAPLFETFANTIFVDTRA